MLTLSSGENDDIILKGASHFDARTFSDGVKDAWISFNLAAFEMEAGRFERIHVAVAALTRPTRYPAACSMASLLTDARSLGATLLSKLQPGASGTDKTQSVAQMRNFVAEPAAVRTAAISTFVIAELARRKELFSTFTAQLPRLPLGLNQWRLQWLTFATTVNLPVVVPDLSGFWGAVWRRVIDGQRLFRGQPVSPDGRSKQMGQSATPCRQARLRLPRNEHQ